MSRKVIQEYLGLPSSDSATLSFLEVAVAILIAYTPKVLYQVFRRRPLTSETNQSWRATLTGELLVTVDEDPEEPSYEQAAPGFEFDYDRCNPATSRKAVRAWMQKSECRLHSKVE